ncbi:allergen Api m 6.03 / Api m 6.04-like [Prorops nasuta]|uniref:allergen Api m 6.03 / Api m 6.04-like n=1 Tax=Prorops nasuta TaxID=863751 RepID=UPI0034CD72B0
MRNIFVFSVVLLVSSVFPVRPDDDNDGNWIDPDNFDYTMTCGENEVYSECDASPECQRTCQNMDQWDDIPCPRSKVCVNGCICTEGYAFDEYEQSCILQTHCPRVKH